MSGLLDDTVASVFRAHEQPGSGAQLDPDLWEALAESGLTLVGVDAHWGGSGGSLQEVFIVLAAAARALKPIPLAESMQAAGVLAEAGLASDTQLQTLGWAPELALTRLADGWRVQGAVNDVPWAGSAATVVLVGACLGQDVCVVLDRQACTVQTGANLAGEPRDRLVIDRLVAQGAVLPPGAAIRHWRRGALLRAFQMCGTAEEALRLSLVYATEREQFGRPIGHFQAVQQQLAEAAGEVRALRRACETAVRLCDDHGFDSSAGLLAVAATKGQASTTASVVARVAHQVHGALGLTREHALGRLTTRLWSWRDEGGDERYWFGQLADAARERSNLWAMVTEGT